MTSALPKLGIIAGGGTAPQAVIEACRRDGRPYFIFCLEGQADAGLAAQGAHQWQPLGALIRLRDAVRAEGIQELVLIGHVRRPSLLEIKPDWLALKILTKIGINSLGDDALLRAIGKALAEETGARVIGVQDIFGDLVVPVGRLGRHKPDAVAEADIQRGMQLAATLGALDVGQSVVVQQGLVLGVEAIEGTDALIARCGALRREGEAGVLIKRAKPQQDDRYDLPTIGPDTIRSLQAAGLRGVAVEAGRALIVERAETIRLADEAGLFIVGVSA
ncbi:MAG: UDP-2,3-diacylglucosamine diphosphatase LpxI [Alphaproteobacteria bacterium]|nr:UDP-2,3-diacylglucosamine diphosphatase LpxI [Alphaproteobacteria bacterium]MBV8548416.1 UDP-2,3-diacylglucosamine diphosphatase LpxI [Alphaproteobacteria bacterium]